MLNECIYVYFSQAVWQWKGNCYLLLVWSYLVWLALMAFGVSSGSECAPIVVVCIILLPSKWHSTCRLTMGRNMLENGQNAHWCIKNSSAE